MTEQDKDALDLATRAEKGKFPLVLRLPLAAHIRRLVAENEAKDAVMRQALEALAGYRREIGMLTGQNMLQPCDAEDALRQSLGETT